MLSYPRRLLVAGVAAALIVLPLQSCNPGPSPTGPAKLVHFESPAELLEYFKGQVSNLKGGGKGTVFIDDICFEQ